VSEENWMWMAATRSRLETRGREGLQPMDLAGNIAEGRLGGEAEQDNTSGKRYKPEGLESCAISAEFCIEVTKSRKVDVSASSDVYSLLWTTPTPRQMQSPSFRTSSIC
jgi:hypothetical protein